MSIIYNYILNIPFAVCFTFIPNTFRLAHVRLDLVLKPAYIYSHDSIKQKTNIYWSQYLNYVCFVSRPLAAEFQNH